MLISIRGGPTTFIILGLVYIFMSAAEILSYYDAPLMDTFHDWSFGNFLWDLSFTFQA